MRNDEAQQFRELIQSTFEVFGTKTSADALTIWWNALAPYSIDQVRAALSDHVRASVYPPKPADVIRAINAHDGRPGVEEAWGIALSAADESETVVWTDEIAAAKNACDEILDAGDEVGARMAFKERYEQEVSNARAAQCPVRWHPSLGHDPDQRTNAIRAAYEQGRLGAKAVHHHLPKPDALEIAGPFEQGDNKLLTDQRADRSDEERVDDETARENLRQLRETLAGVSTEPDPIPDEGVVQRTQAWAEARRDEVSEQAETTAEGEQ